MKPQTHMMMKDWYNLCDQHRSRSRKYLTMEQHLHILPDFSRNFPSQYQLKTSRDFLLLQGCGVWLTFSILRTPRLWTHVDRPQNVNKRNIKLLFIRKSTQRPSENTFLNLDLDIIFQRFPELHFNFDCILKVLEIENIIIKIFTK